MLRKATIAGHLAGLAQLGTAQWSPNQLIEGPPQDENKLTKARGPMFSRYQIAKDSRLHINDFKRQILGTDSADEAPSREACSRAVNRMKHETADFNQIFRKANADPEFAFTDEFFTFPDSIHWPDVPALDYPLTDDVDFITWTRISDEFKDPKYTMWGSGDIEPDDAIQGQLGNCWLHVAAMSLAEDPERIRDIFLIDEKNSAGVYAAQMYLLGMPITVIIDDYLPLTKSWSGKAETLYGKIGEDHALWGSIYEKVFAKYLGNYEAIDAGLGSHGIEATNGSPIEQWNHEDVLEMNRSELLWREMVKKDEEGAMITSGSYTGTGSDQDKNAFGLPYNHAFSIMQVTVVTDADGETHRLVCLRNPWGVEFYFGDWSDSSDLWTDDLRAQANHYDANDGKYCMSFMDYVKQMEYTDFNRDVSELFHSSFAVFGDDEPLNRQRVFYEDPTEYNVHTLKVYSSEPQRISLSSFSYHFKQYHGACLREADQTEVLIQKPGGNILYPVWPGSYHDEFINVQEGTLEVNVFTRFGENDLLPHDWSLVVWSEKSKVRITHKDGLKNKQFRNLEVDETVPIPTDFEARVDFSKALTYSIEQEFSNDSFVFNEKITQSNDRNEIIFAMMLNGATAEEGLISTNISNEGKTLLVKFGDQALNCTIPDNRRSCRELLFLTPEQSIQIVHTQSESKIVFGPNPELYKIQMAWIFNREDETLTRQITSFMDGSSDIITWVCTDGKYIEIDRKGEYKSVNWFQLGEEVETGEDLTLAYVIEKFEFDDIYMFSELLTFSGAGAEVNIQAQRNGEIIEMRSIKAKISADLSSMTVTSGDTEFFCAVTDKPVCTKQAILDDGALLKIEHSTSLQRVILYPDVSNLDVELSWNYSPVMKTFNRTTIWLEDNHQDSVVWSFSELGLSQISQEGVFESIAWTDNLGNFGKYVKGDEVPGGTDVPEALELNYNLESEVLSDRFLYSESVMFTMSYAEIKFMMLLNGEMVDQGIMNATKSADMRSVQVTYGNLTLACSIEEGEKSCRQQITLGPESSILVVHSTTKTRITYEPNNDLYQLVQNWEFNHILNTYEKSVTTLKDMSRDSIVWSISPLGIQEKSKSGNFQNIVWLQNIPSALVGFGGEESLALNYIYETTREEGNYLFTESVVFKSAGAEITFLVLLDGGFQDSRAFNISLSEDGSKILAQLDQIVFSCEISPEEPVCRAVSKFEEVYNMEIVHSYDYQQVYFYPNKDQLDIQMLWEYRMGDMTFKKQTTWQDTNEVDQITWGFNDDGAKQVSREGDYNRLFWSDSLGNSGTLADELGPILPEPVAPDLTFSLGYKLDSCVFDDVYSSIESITLNPTDSTIEIVYSVLLNNERIDQGVITIFRALELNGIRVEFKDETMFCGPKFNGKCEDFLELNDNQALYIQASGYNLALTYMFDSEEDIGFVWTFQGQNIVRLNYLPQDYQDIIYWQMGENSVTEVSREGFCGVKWLDEEGNEQAPPERLGGIFDVIDVGKDSGVIYDFVLSSEEAGDIEETIWATLDQELMQKVIFTTPEGTEVELSLNLVVNEDGVSQFPFEVTDSFGFIQEYTFECEEACDKTKKVGDIIIDFIADPQAQQFNLTYTNPADPEIGIDQFLDLNESTWFRVVSVDGEAQFNKTWEYRFPNLEFTPALFYDKEIDVYGNETFTFDEDLRFFDGYQNLTYAVYRNEDVADGGTIIMIQADPNNQRVIFGDREMLCVVDSSRKCTVRFYDASQQRNWVYIYQQNGDFSMTFQTRYYTMQADYDAKTLTYARKNQFFDGTDTYDEKNLGEEIDKFNACLAEPEKCECIYAENCDDPDGSTNPDGSDTNGETDIPSDGVFETTANEPITPQNYDVTLSNDEIGEITETIMTTPEGDIEQTITITSPDGQDENQIRVTPTFENNMSIIEVEVEDEFGQVESTVFVCFDVCEETVQLGDITIDFSGDVSEDEVNLVYTQSGEPEIQIDQVINSEEQTWDRTVSVEGEPQFEYPWSYNFDEPDPTDTDGTDGGNNDDTNPDGTDPDGGSTTPDGSNTDGTDGDNTDGTNPDGSNPDGSNPDDTNPDGTDPEGTDPESGTEIPTDGVFKATANEPITPQKYNVTLTDDEIGEITETITTTPEGEIEQTITITSPDGQDENQIRVTPSIQDGMTVILIEVEDEFGDVEEATFVCFDVCEESAQIGDIVVDFYADVNNNEVGLDYTQPGDPEISIEQFANTEEQTWDRTVSVDGEPQFENPWSYNFDEPDPTDTDGTDGGNPDGSNPDGDNTDGTDPDGGSTTPDGSNTDGTDGDNTDGNNPDGTNPDGTDPDGTNPDGSNTDGTDEGNPDGSDPDGGDSNETNPDGSDPNEGNTDGSNPDGSNPDGSNPDGSNSDGSNSDGSNPDGSNPDGSNPDGSNPDGSNSDGSNPDGTDPDGTDPDGTDTAGTDGDNTDGSDPDGSNTDNTDPDGSNPDGTNPDGSNPDGSNPDGSNPDGSNPDGSNPDGTNPDGTDPEGTDNDEADQPWPYSDTEDSESSPSGFDPANIPVEVPAENFQLDYELKSCINDDEYTVRETLVEIKKDAFYVYYFTVLLNDEQIEQGKISLLFNSTNMSVSYLGDRGSSVVFCDFEADGNCQNFKIVSGSSFLQAQVQDYVLNFNFIPDSVQYEITMSWAVFQNFFKRQNLLTNGDENTIIWSYSREGGFTEVGNEGFCGVAWVDDQENDNYDDSEGAGPDGSDPDGGNTDGTNPDEGSTTPDGSNPDGSNPDDTNPDGTNPDGNPDDTNPEGTNPDETNPDGTNPDGTTTDGSNTDEGDSNDTNPDGTNPDDTNPDGGNPDETNPDDTDSDGSDSGAPWPYSGNGDSEIIPSGFKPNTVPPEVPPENFQLDYELESCIGDDVYTVRETVVEYVKGEQYGMYFTLLFNGEQIDQGLIKLAFDDTVVFMRYNGETLTCDFSEDGNCSDSAIVYGTKPVKVHVEDYVINMYYAPGNTETQFNMGWAVFQNFIRRQNFYGGEFEDTIIWSFREDDGFVEVGSQGFCEVAWADDLGNDNLDDSDGTNPDGSSPDGSTPDGNNPNGGSDNTDDGSTTPDDNNPDDSNPDGGQDNTDGGSTNPDGGSDSNNDNNDGGSDPLNPEDPDSGAPWPYSGNGDSEIIPSGFKPNTVPPEVPPENFQLDYELESCIGDDVYTVRETVVEYVKGEQYGMYFTLLFNGEQIDQGLIKLAFDDTVVFMRYNGETLTCDFSEDGNCSDTAIVYGKKPIQVFVEDYVINMYYAPGDTEHEFNMGWAVFQNFIRRQNFYAGEFEDTIIWSFREDDGFVEVGSEGFCEVAWADDLGNDNLDDSEGTGTDGTDPDGTNPDGSNPDGTNPDGSNPDGSDPDGSSGNTDGGSTSPDGNNPDDSSPDGGSTNPDGSSPDDSNPDGGSTNPDGSNPDDSNPDGGSTNPDGSNPDDSNPDGGSTNPDGSNPDDSNPDGGSTNPDGSNPDDSNPDGGSTNPDGSNPDDSNPDGGSTNPDGSSPDGTTPDDGSDNPDGGSNNPDGSNPDGGSSDPDDTNPEDSSNDNTDGGSDPLSPGGSDDGPAMPASIDTTFTLASDNDAEFEWLAKVDTEEGTVDLFEVSFNAQVLNATAVDLSIYVTDYKAFSCSIHQIIKVNETNKAMSMIDCKDYRFIEDTSLDLNEGMKQITYEWQRNEFEVNMRLTEDKLEQAIIIDGQDFYLHNKIDFAEKVMDVSLIYKQNKTVSSTEQWDLANGIFTCVGLLEADDIVNTRAAYERGYDQGFADGMNDEEPEPISEEIMKQASKAFPAWVEDQEMSTGVQECNSDVRIDQPFPGEPRFWALWAQHDCQDYDLILSVVLDKDTQENFIGFIGGQLSENGCVDIYWMNGAVACEFELKAGGENFGILFKGGFQPIFYTTEWASQRQDTWNAAFSWW